MKDAAEYAIELLEKGQAGETYNLGASKCISIKDLVYLIADLMEVKNIQIKIDKKKLRPDDIERLESDNTKIHKIVNYRPQVSFKKGILKTINYYKKYGWHF